MPLVDRWLQRRAEKRVARGYVAARYVDVTRLLTPEEAANLREHLLSTDRALLERLRDD